uniref:Uncharacterized protein n=1 Tax=Amphilophus citrinellus TaxID=61819 RepID=A0A3Q0RTC9_AMPCI
MEKHSYSHGCRRGVIILILNSVKYECVKGISDKEGIYILVKGKLKKEMVTVVNLSAPPNSGKQFFRPLFDTMKLEMEGILTMWYTLLMSLDQQFQSGSIKTLSVTAIHQLFAGLDTS